MNISPFENIPTSSTCLTNCKKIGEYGHSSMIANSACLLLRPLILISDKVLNLFLLLTLLKIVTRSNAVLKCCPTLPYIITSFVDFLCTHIIRLCLLILRIQSKYLSGIQYVCHESLFLGNVNVTRIVPLNSPIGITHY